MHHRPRLPFSALLVGTIAASIGCSSGDPDFPDNARPVSVQPLAAAEPLRFYSGMTTQQRLVVRDDATWGNVWQQLAGTSQPAPAVPVVDFASQLVIVAAMGTRSTGGYSIDIDDVRTLTGDAWVSVTEQSPGSGCGTTQALTAPAAVVVVPRFDGEAMFLEHTSQHACR